MESTKIKKNLYFVSFSFLFNMSAYFSMEGLQSSLNRSIGTISLSALYISLVFSSLFLPPMCIEIWGCKKVLACGTASYTFYTLANFYPRAYTLVPTAIILGAGSSLIWSSSRVYISNLACLYARNEWKDVEKCTGYFFGIFNAVFSWSLFVGPLIASTTLYFSGIEIANSTFLNSSASPAYDESLSTFAISKCGVDDCDNDSDIEEKSIDGGPVLNETVLYLLLAVYTAMNVTGVLFIVFGMDDMPATLKNPPENDDNDNEYIKNASPAGKATLPRTFETRIDNSQTEDEGIVYRTKKKKKISALMEVIATVKFMMSSRLSMLVVLLTIHMGQVQSFALGTFTSQWVKCSRGVEIVGFILAGYGLTASITGALYGYLLRWISRSCIFLIASIITVCVSILLLNWEPTEDNEIPLFIFVCCCYGIVYVTYNSVLIASYSIFFEDNKAAANAAFMAWYSLGASVFYALGSVMCASTALYLLIVISVIATALCLTAEHIFRRTKSREASSYLSTA